MQRFFNYISQSRVELAKVSWPSRQQATKLTLVVVVFTMVFAVFIASLDWGLNELLQRVVLKSK